MFGLTILGNNSALPAHGRHPTAQVLSFGQHTVLIDCGEGTQIQMAALKVKRSRIHHIFISHLHGDHYFGLPGLINSMALMGRTDPLNLYGPPELMPILQLQFNAAHTQLPFELAFTPIYQAGMLVETPKFTVECFAVQHRIACWGYLFTECKFKRKLNHEAAIAAGIPTTFFGRLQHGEDYISAAGELISNASVTFANTPARSYAYCADTIFDTSLCTKLQGVNLLYHEATYLSHLEERAKARFHSTAAQAATIAKMAGVKKLLIGHFSSKYAELDQFLQEAQAVFPQTDLALEGVTYRVI
ncbi:MAG: ribonuclease Z [Bacteroidetes bacterium]|nr:MAG: ribonuclease Z [Bacteroidota bacterium]